jgi:nucleoid DNA-binding protein
MSLTLLQQLSRATRPLGSTVQPLIASLAWRERLLREAFRQVAIAIATSGGARVAVPNLGSFTVRTRSARLVSAKFGGQGEGVRLQPSTVHVRFKPEPWLRDLLKAHVGGVDQ